MFTAVAINGSPRKRGNTYHLLDLALEPLRRAGWRTEILQLGKQPVRGCAACFRCFKNRDGRCVLPEDAVSQAMAAMYAADAIILGSPAYFSDVTAEMKALLDRAGIVSLGNDNLLKGRLGAAVVAQRRGGALHAYDTMHHFFQLCCMLIPGSTFWNMGFGEYPGDVVKNDAEALHNMENLGKALAWLGELTIPHRDSFPRLWNRYAPSSEEDDRAKPEAPKEGTA